MGPYCQFCDHRCFVERHLPADATNGYAGWNGILATCKEGAAYDLKITGYDHTTAINPVTGAPGGTR